MDWLARARPVALGYGIRPWDFDVATPAETAEMLAAFHDAETRTLERLGWAVAMLLSPWSKKPITLDTLLGPSYTAWRLKREAAAAPSPRGT